MGIQLNRIENGVLYVVSTPGNSFNTIEEFVEDLDRKIADEEMASVSRDMGWTGGNLQRRHRRIEQYCELGGGNASSPEDRRGCRIRSNQEAG